MLIVTAPHRGREACRYPHPWWWEPHHLERATVLEADRRQTEIIVLGARDSDLVGVYTKHLAGLGGELHTNSKVSKVVKQNGGLQVQFSTGGEGGAVDADQVLLAVGRVPFTHGLDADKAGVKLDKFGDSQGKIGGLFDTLAI